jgi:hypothetical protein
VRYTHYFSSNFCHHGSGGTAVVFAPSREDPYLSLCKKFKLIVYLFQELWCCKVEVPNCDTAVPVAAGH